MGANQTHGPKISTQEPANAPRSEDCGLNEQLDCENQLISVPAHGDEPS
jgi:hypothetical protein